MEKEPERYYDWMLWKMRQEDAKMKQNRFDEYGHYGENNPPVGYESAPVFEKGYPSYEAVNPKVDTGLNLDPSGSELYRRELIAAANSFETVKMDMQRLTEDYYKLINRIKELSEENISLKKQINELTNTHIPLR